MSAPTTATGAARRVHSRPHRPVPDLFSARPVRLSGLTGPEAEEMLQWLGANGCPRIELSLDGDRCCLAYCWRGATRSAGGP